MLTKWASAPVDADALAWNAAVIANGGTVSGSTLRAVSNFARSAKALGLWSKFSRLNLICGNQLAAAQVPLIAGGGNSLETLTNIVAGDYVETGATAGIKGNGTNKYIDTGWNPVAQSSSTSSFGLWGYVKGTEAGFPSRAIIGSLGTSGGTNVTYLGWASAGTAEQGFVASAAGAPAAQASTQGLLGISVNGSRAQQFYVNGAATGAPVTAAQVFQSLSLFSLAGNQLGTANYFSTRYLRTYAITTGMSAADAANFNTIMQTFQTALGRNV